MSLSPSGATGNIIPRGYKTGQLQQFTPEQMNQFKQLFAFTDPSSQLYQQAMGSEQGFAPMEQRAMRDFQNFQGLSANRFSSAGAGSRGLSGRHSSDFQNFQTQGAQDFASSLAEKRQALQRQALMDLMGISHSLLGERPYEQFLIEKTHKPKWWEVLLQGLGENAGAFGKLGAQYLTGGIG